MDDESARKSLSNQTASFPMSGRISIFRFGTNDAQAEAGLIITAVKVRMPQRDEGGLK